MIKWLQSLQLNWLDQADAWPNWFGWLFFLCLTIGGGAMLVATAILLGHMLLFLMDVAAGLILELLKGFYHV